MATAYGGYMGKVLKVNLTTQQAEEYPFSDRDRELYIGGKMMAAKILSDHLQGNEKAFSDDNMLVITTGPADRYQERPVPADSIFLHCLR